MKALCTLIIALIVPSFPQLKAWSEKNGIPFSSPQQLIREPKIIEKYQEVTDEKNTNFGHTEQIKKFRLVPEEWTIQGGQLTPTMKLKRKVIMERYSDVVNSMYTE